MAWRCRGKGFWLLPQSVDLGLQFLDPNCVLQTGFVEKVRRVYAGDAGRNPILNADKRLAKRTHVDDSTTCDLFVYKTFKVFDQFVEPLLRNGWACSPLWSNRDGYGPISSSLAPCARASLADSAMLRRTSLRLSMCEERLYCG